MVVVLVGVEAADRMLSVERRRLCLLPVRGRGLQLLEAELLELEEHLRIVLHLRVAEDEDRRLRKVDVNLQDRGPRKLSV